nr:porin [Alsobacter ponti]
MPAVLPAWSARAGDLPAGKARPASFLALCAPAAADDSDDDDSDDDSDSGPSAAKASGKGSASASGKGSGKGAKSTKSLDRSNYFRVPGWDSCLAIGGEIEVDGQVNQAYSRRTNALSSSVIGRIAIDSLTTTEFGDLRAFVRLPVTYSSGLTTLQGPSTSVDVDYAFITWNTLTFGYADSVFNFYNNALNIGTLRGPALSATIARYKTTFGNGFTFSVSMEMGATEKPTGIPDPGNSIVLDAIPQPAGTIWPDPVTALQLDRDWGSAIVAGALHQVRSPLGAGGGAWGGAAMVGLNLNTPWTGDDDEIWLQGVGAWGASTYLGFGRAALIGNLGFAVADSVTTIGGRLIPSRGAAITGGWSHDLNDTWNVSLFSSWATFDPRADLPARPFVRKFNELRIGSDLTFAPFDDFSITGEVMWGRISSSVPTPALDGLKLETSSNAWQGTVQLLRTF